MDMIDAIRDSAPYLRSWMEFQVDRHRVPGAQVAIRVGEELVASFAVGVANVNTGDELTTDHLFHIASHSKTFTATAIFQLVEEGSLRLDDTVEQWIGELVATPSAEMTVRELLGHQSGISRDSASCDHWQLLSEFPERDGVLDMAREDAIYGPNEHFKYSNVGYSLLGEIIAAASGQSYEDYVTAHIIEPLGLERTGPEMRPDLESQAAACHSALMSGNDVRRVIPPTYSNAMAAATGFYSTAEEVSQYMACHATGRTELLTDASKRLMQRQESTIDGSGYGLGMQTLEFNGRKLVGHSGGWPGHITRTWLDPKSGLCVSVLTNCLGALASEWCTSLIALIDLAVAAPKDATVPDGVDLDSFTGRFAGQWGVEDIARLGGRLVALPPGALDIKGAASELTVVDADTLRPAAKDGYGMENEPMHVVRAADGNIERIIHGATSWPIDVFRQMLEDGWLQTLK